MRIITSWLSKYPQIERSFKTYELAWETKEGESYCPILVRDLYANYMKNLENLIHKGEKVTKNPNKDRIPVRGSW